jgi:hypothetical protein
MDLICFCGELLFKVTLVPSSKIKYKIICSTCGCERIINIDEHLNQIVGMPFKKKNKG